MLSEGIKPVAEYLKSNPDAMGISSSEYAHMAPPQRELFLKASSLLPPATYRLACFSEALRFSVVFYHP